MISDFHLAVINSHCYNDGKDLHAGMLTHKGITIPYKTIHYFDPTFEVEGVLYSLENCNVLSMRGTEATANPSKFFVNLWDVIRDIRFLPWRTSYGWGHSGFCKGARYWLEEHQHKIPLDKPLVLTGHSMGAQIAIWIAMMSGWSLYKVVVFAEPKGFFASSKTQYRKLGLDKITRSYINNRDWIEDVPPWGKRSVVPRYAGEGGHSIDDYVELLRNKA